MKTKTTYLSELGAAQQENMQLANWLRDAQERLILKQKAVDRLTRYIERQSGAKYDDGMDFFYTCERVFGDGFHINPDGSICPLTVIRGD